jgi:hypothetical protein
MIQILLQNNKGERKNVGDELETMSIALTDITQAACACHSLFS